MQDKRLRELITSSVLFGLSAGFTASVLVAGLFTVWNWVENPEGIFHGASGTNWGFVFDTAISWVVPVFLYTAMGVSVLHRVVSSMIATPRKKHSIETEDSEI